MRHAVITIAVAGALAMIGFVAGCGEEEPPPEPPERFERQGIPQREEPRGFQLPPAEEEEERTPESGEEPLVPEGY